MLVQATAKGMSHNLDAQIDDLHAVDEKDINSPYAAGCDEVAYTTRMTDKELLDIYSDYLISAFGLTTATGLSSLLEGQLSHDRIQRFLASEQRTSNDLWLIVKPHIRAIQQLDGVLIVDDSIAEKRHIPAYGHSTPEKPLVLASSAILQSRDQKLRSATVWSTIAH